jgi:hypothetical protein
MTAAVFVDINLTYAKSTARAQLRAETAPARLLFRNPPLKPCGSAGCPQLFNEPRPGLLQRRVRLLGRIDPQQSQTA